MLLLTLSMLVFSFQAKAQTCPVVAFTDCGEFDVTVCKRTTALPNPPNCEGCTASPIDCHRMQYVIRLSADDGITDHLDPDALCFILDYSELEIETMLSFTGTSSGMTRFNPDATMSVCTSVSLNEAENTAYLIYDDVGGTLPVIEFTRTATNAPFYAEIFTIVVDVYPGDQFQLTCPFFRYADGDNITCYIPNSFTPPAPDFIAPVPYELALDNDNNVMFMTGDPVLNMDNSGVTIPLRMRSNYTFPVAPLSIPYLDYYFTWNQPLQSPRLCHRGPLGMKLISAQQQVSTPYIL